jgi:cobalt-zinc-cadmium efflux system outer membrane protein
MRRIRHLFIAMACATAAGPAWAGDDLASDPLRVDVLVAEARRSNPEIRAAEAQWLAARARPVQAATLPDPMLEVAYHNESLDELALGETEFAWLSIGASQEVPFPGKLRLKREIATREAERAHTELRRVELEVVARLKMAYAEYAHLQEVIALIERNKLLLQKLARTAEARYAVGDAIQQDVLKAHVELSLLLDRETKLEQQRRSETARLNALLDRPPWAPLGSPEHPSASALTQTLEALTQAASVHAPELRSAELQISAGESSVSLARRSFFPDFQVRADYMHKAALLPEWEVGVGISVPLYLAGRRGALDEARATLSAARASRDETRRRIEFRVKDLYLRGRASERLVSLYGTTVLPQAQLALESATAAYQVGKVDFLTLLNSFTVMLEYEMRYHEELSSFQKTVAELEATIGEPLSEVVQ